MAITEMSVPSAWLLDLSSKLCPSTMQHMLKKDLYSRLSLNGHLYKTDTSVKQTHRVGPCLSLLLLFDSL